MVEIVSDASVAKDRRRLPQLYARAGVPELWLVDARGKAPSLEIWTLAAPDGPGPDAWTLSPMLGCRFRLRRAEAKEPFFVYHELESAP